ncbi:putative aliphatic sulfonates transport permease protein SsuC [Micromonospora sp. MW-13]|nr:putative aliphatic sulfonates transport permease protein SsuC [Micromonospora sp. MW-13]
MTERRLGRLPRTLLGATSVVAFLLIWQGYVKAADVPAYTLPGPVEVVRYAGQLLAGDQLLVHIRVTAVELLQGVAIGLTVGVLAGVMAARWRWLERLAMPLLVLIQITPKIAIAPLLVLWLGLGVTSKITLVALVTFFPVLVNTLAGLRDIGTAYRHLCQVLAMSGTQRFFRVELPMTLPHIVVGLRLGALAGVTAAVIGELIGAQAGLGFMVAQGQETDNVPQSMVGLLLLSLLGLLAWSGIGTAASWLRSRFGVAGA